MPKPHRNTRRGSKMDRDRVGSVRASFVVVVLVAACQPSLDEPAQETGKLATAIAPSLAPPSRSISANTAVPEHSLERRTFAH